MMVPKYANLLKPFNQKYVICNKNKMELYRNNCLLTFRNNKNNCKNYLKNMTQKEKQRVTKNCKLSRHKILLKRWHS